jgi:2',3'-cyclic-nucleotide 2'-phosphodiesterase (5'-nucleotidase family)
MKSIFRAVACYLLALPLGALVTAAARVASAQEARASEEIRTVQARQQETGFGNTVADGLRAATRADIAWIAGGEFRDTTLKREAASAEEALSILDDPTDPLVIVTLAGGTVREALELSLQQYPKPGKAFLHVSGLQVTFTARPQGSRRVLTVRVQGQPLVGERLYRVAMTRTLAIGSFGFFRLWPEAKNARPETATIGEALREAVANSPFKSRGDGRMVEKPAE